MTDITDINAVMAPIILILCCSHFCALQKQLSPPSLSETEPQTSNVILRPVLPAEFMYLGFHTPPFFLYGSPQILHQHAALRSHNSEITESLLDVF